MATKEIINAIVKLEDSYFVTASQNEIYLWKIGVN